MSFGGVRETEDGGAWASVSRGARGEAKNRVRNILVLECLNPTGFDPTGFPSAFDSRTGDGLLGGTV